MTDRIPLLLLPGLLNDAELWRAQIAEAAEPTYDFIVIDECHNVADGTTIAMTVTDDTLPGGPRQVTRTYTAPFARANREEDYRIAWAFFVADLAEEI